MKGKKVIMFVVMLMVFALTMNACGNGSVDTKSGGEAKYQAIKTGLTPETLKGVKIGYCVLDYTDSSVALYADAAKDYFEKLGATVTIADCQYDQGKQIEQMENFVSQGVKMIIVWPMSADSLQDVSQKIRDMGVQVFWQGVTLDPNKPVDGSRDTDNSLMGDAIANQATAWLDKQYPDAAPGSIHVSVFTFDLVDPTKARGEAMIKSIEADPRCKVTFKKDTVMSADAGATAAEEALAVDPEIKLFLCFESSAGIGVNTVLKSNFGDVTAYGAFGGGTSDAVLGLIGEAKADPAKSALRGCIQSGSEDLVADACQNYIDVLTNKAPFPYLVMTQLYPHTSFDYKLPEGWETGARPK